MNPSVAYFRGDFSRPSERFVTAPLPYLNAWRPILVGWRGTPGAHGVPSERCVFYQDLPRSGPLYKLLWRLGYHPPAGVARLRRERVCLCHAHFGEDGAIALPLAQRLGIPLVVSFYGQDVTRLPTWRTCKPAWLHYWLTFGRLREQAVLALAYCRFLADRLVTLGWPAERIRVHYPGVAFPEAPLWHRRSRLVLAIGRLVEKKGFDTLLEATAVLANQGLEPRVAILGDGPLRKHLQALAVRRGLSRVVTFGGWVSPAELPAWYERAALLVAPSKRSGDGDMEGLPTVLVEAAANGIPLIGTSHAGIPEIVRNGESGLLVPEQNPDALAAAMRVMLGDEELRARCGASARRLVSAEFRIETQASILERVYDEVCQRSGIK